MIFSNQLAINEDYFSIRWMEITQYITQDFSAPLHDNTTRKSLAHRFSLVSNINLS